MPHQRQVIREKVRDVLIAAATAAGTRVYATRVLNLRATELPAISVLTPDEESDDENTAPRELERSLTVLVIGYVAAVANVLTGAVNVDNAMDDLALQIETALHADPFLGGTVGGKGAVLVSTEMAEKQEGDRMVGIVGLTYDVTYYTLAPEAPAVLDDFLRVKATHNLGGEVHPGDDAEDEFDVQEAP